MAAEVAAASAGAAVAGGSAMSAAFTGVGMAAMLAIQAIQQRAAAKAALRVANAQTAASSSTALSAARTTAAQTVLASVQGSLRQQKFVREGGTAMEALLLNAANADRTAVANSVEGQLAAAESEGARMALQGAVGLSTAADAVDAASAIRYARATRQSESVRRLTNYGFAQQAEALADQVWSGAPSSFNVPTYTPTSQAITTGAIPSITGVALTGLLKSITADPAGWGTRLQGWGTDISNMFSQPSLYPPEGTPQAGP